MRTPLTRQPDASSKSLAITSADTVTSDDDEACDPVDALGEDFLARRRRGEPVRIADYELANPPLADQIQRHFRTLLALESLKSYSDLSDRSSEHLRPALPEQLGDFRLLREIGRGGMGVVYEAQQVSLQRRVAVKVFTEKPGCDQQQLERFKREASTAASLHHTNIVPVFGVGEQDGIHYFVMQRIDGISLDQLVDEERNTRKLDWKWVASIGSQIADAVSYAHAQGVLHRDIKPANLILDPADVVWITDFGLATIVDLTPSAVNGNLFDRAEDRGKIIGTLRYMAPEQIGGHVDTRSDVYSIGATLYELVTRRPAYESHSRAKLIDLIMRGDFVPPRKIDPEIPRDLEAILIKAMSRDETERYDSAEQLATDLRRFTGDRPVMARPIHAFARLLRWSRRGPAVASLASALFLLMLLSFTIVSLKWHDSVVANQRAEENLSLALESLDHILQRYTSGWMATPASTNPLSDEPIDATVPIRMVVSDHNATVLQDALRFYDKFLQQNPRVPRVQLDIAKVHRRVADIYLRLGRFTHAESAYLRTLEILDAQPRRDQYPLALERAETRNQLGLALHSSSRFNEAYREFELSRLILTASDVSQRTECQVELARTYTNLGHSQWLMLQQSKSRQSHRRAIAILEKVASENADQPAYRLALARAYRAYYPLASPRQNDERSRLRREGIELLELLVRQYPDVPDYQCELSEMLCQSIHRPHQTQLEASAFEQLNRGIELARELHQSHPSIPQYRAVLARALQESSRRLRSVDLTAADRKLEESLILYQGLASEFPRTPAYRIMVAATLRHQAMQLLRAERFDEAQQVLTAGIESQRNYVGMRPGNRFGQTLLADLHADLAKSLDALGEVDAAAVAEDESTRLKKQIQSVSDSSRGHQRVRGSRGR